LQFCSLPKSLNATIPADVLRSQLFATRASTYAGHDSVDFELTRNLSLCAPTVLAGGAAKFRGDSTPEAGVTAVVGLTSHCFTCTQAHHDHPAFRDASPDRLPHMRIGFRAQLHWRQARSVAIARQSTLLLPNS
jgi:hypothetical protein